MTDVVAVPILIGRASVGASAVTVGTAPAEGYTVITGIVAGVEGVAIAPLYPELLLNFSDGLGVLRDSGTFDEVLGNWSANINCSIAVNPGEEVQIHNGNTASSKVFDVAVTAMWYRLTDAQ